MIDNLVRERTVTAPSGQSVHALVAQYVTDPVLQAYTVVMIDATPLAASEWEATRLHAGQSVTLALRPAGDSGKKVLRTILTIAVVAVAAWVAGPAGISFFGSKLAASVAGAALSIAGNFAVNALLPPPGATGARTEVDPTYSLTGTRNQARPGQVCPVIMGDHWFTPDLITEQLQEVVGDDIWLRFGVCVGIGNYEVPAIRIGDTPIGDYGSAIQVQRSLTVDAPAQTLFPGDVSQESLSITLENTNWQSRTTAVNAEDIDILLAFPRGLGTRDKKGNPEAVSVTIEVRYRPVGESTWNMVAVDNGLEADDIAQALQVNNRRDYWSKFNDFTPYANGLSGANASDLSRTFTRSDIKPFFRNIRLSLPPGRQYEIEVRRATPKSADVSVANDVQWIGLNSWTERNIAPDPRMATLWFRIQASDNLAGFVDTLNVRAQKLVRTLNVADPLEFDPALITASDWSIKTTSRNVADMLLDASTGLHTDNPTPDSEIDYQSLAEFWKWCYINNYTFDLPIVQATTRGEVEQMICAAGRGRPYRHLGKKKIAIDREHPEGPRQLITPQNARDFTFTRTFAREVHALRVRFSNREIFNGDDYFLVYADGYSEDNATLFEEISFPGETDYDQVYKKARYVLDTALKANLLASFEMDIEADTLELGDYVRLQHPVMNAAAVSARVLSVSDQALTLTEQVPFDPSLSYVMRHRRIASQGGLGMIEAEGVYPINTGSGEEDVVTLSSPLPSGVVIAPDDIVVVGIASEDTFEGLISDIQPSGPGTTQIELVSYLPERLTVPNVPAHVPPSADLYVLPVPPTLVSARAETDQLTVIFNASATPSRRLARFKVDWRKSSVTDPASWTAHPDLSPLDRSVTIPITGSLQAYDVRIIAVDYDGLASLPLIVSNIVPDILVPAPDVLSVTGVTRISPSELLTPALDVSLDAGTGEAVFDLFTEAREAGTQDAFQVISSHPADVQQFDIFGVQPGQNLDVRFYWRHPLGAVTPLTSRPVFTSVTIPSNRTASDTAALGGTPATEVLQNFTDINNSFTTIEQSLTDVDATIADANDRIDQARADIRARAASNILTRAGTTIAADDISDPISLSGWGREAQNVSGTQVLVNFENLALVQDQPYSVSFLARVSSGTANIEADLQPDTLPNSPLFHLTDAWQTYKWENFSTPDPAVTNTKLRIFATNLSSQDIFLTDMQFVEGSEAGPWSPAPSELANVQTQITTLEIEKADQAALSAEVSRIDDLSGRVGAAEGNITSIGEVNVQQGQAIDATNAALNVEVQKIDAVTGRIDTAEGNITFIQQVNVEQGQAIDATNAELSTETIRIDTVTATANNNAGSITTAQNAIATNESSIASLDINVTASLLKSPSDNYINNADYSLYNPGALLPAGFAVWTQNPSGGFIREQKTVRNTTSSVRMIIPDAGDHGIQGFNVFPLDGGAPGKSIRAITHGQTFSRYVIMEAWAYMNNGNWNGAGISLHLYKDMVIDSSFGTFVTDALKLNFAEFGGSLGRWIKFEKFFDLGDVSEANGGIFYIFGNWPGFGVGTSFKDIVFGQVNVRPATNQEVSARITAQAFDSPDGSLARIIAEASTGEANTARLRLGAFDTNGVEFNTIALETDRYELFVPAKSTSVPVLEATGERIRANIDLQAGAGIFVGPSNALLPVAVQPFTVFLTDGQSVDFGYDVGDYTIEVSQEGILQPGAGEVFHPRALNKTGTGFTADLAIVTQGVPSTVTEATNATSPAGPDHMVAKADSATASNDVYDFYASGVVTVFAESQIGAGTFYLGVLTVRFYFHDGTSWVDNGVVDLSHDQLGINPTHSSGAQTYTFTNRLIASRTYTGAIRTSATLGCFGCEEDNGTGITDLNSVRYQKAGVSSSRSATPNGELAKIKVTPL